MRRHLPAALRMLVLPLLWLAPALPRASAEEEALLPHDESLVHGALENGLTYVLKRHANPPGRLSLWLHVSSGSLNETDRQRGLAHYLEHMAFNGSKNFEPGSVVRFFESLGMSFGRDQNAFTTFDMTVYQLALPDCKEETVAKGLLFLSDVGMRLSLLPKEIESERQIILEEKRTRAGAEQRIQDYVFERIAPGSVFGQRMPIGTEESILAVQEKDFRDYYGTWYVPSNMTVIAVGDCDMGPVAKAIEKAFADGPKVERPKDRDAGVQPSAEMRAIVATDPEIQSASVGILRVDRPRPPRRTVADLRRDLVDDLGEEAFNRRLQAAVASGKPAFLEARATVREVAETLRMIGADAEGKPGDWKALLRDLALALQQARRYGFTEREVADARKEMLAAAEQGVRREGTLPARALLMRLNRAVASGEEILSPQQALDLRTRLLPGISAEEVSKAFRETFDPANVAFVGRMPSGEGVPTEAELVEAGKSALAVEPPKPAEETRAATLLEKLPQPGKVAEQATHEGTGVWSAWFENGVRLHYRRDDLRKNEVSVHVTLAGGEIEETAQNRGVTEAAVLAWSRPATAKLTSTQVRDLMTGKNVRVQGGSGHDALSLTVSGDPKDLESGLQLAHLLLREPVVEAAAFAQWREATIQRIEGARVQPVGVLMEAIATTFFPGVPSLQVLREEDVARVTREAAEAWIRRLAAAGPIEVAIVGDLDRERAEALAATYLGSLPARPRIGPNLFAELRKLPRPEGPTEVKRSVKTKTPQGFVLDGFFGADQRDVYDGRRLQMASRILSTRMVTIIREQKQLVYSIGAAARPGVEHPGFGMFVAQAPTDPAKGEALGAAIEEVFAAFAKDGPTEDEMVVARKQMANSLDEAMKTPDFWARRLEELDYRGMSLDDTMTMKPTYAEMKGEEVKAVFARYFQPKARFRFVVLPEAP